MSKGRTRKMRAGKTRKGGVSFPGFSATVAKGVAGASAAVAKGAGVLTAAHGRLNTLKEALPADLHTHVEKFAGALSTSAGHLNTAQDHLNTLAAAATTTGGKKSRRKRRHKKMRKSKRH